MKTFVKRTILICIGLVIVSLFFVNLTYAKIDLTTCVGMWLFDEGSGEEALDSSGNGNDGILKGDPEWIKGVFGKALELDGDGDYVEVPDNESLRMTDEITVVFWVKTDKKMVDMWADRQVIVGKHYLEYEVGIYLDGQIHTYTNDGTGGGYDEGIMASMSEELGEGDWTLDEWYHIAWTLNKKHEIAYVNATKIGEYDKAHEGTLEQTHPLEIGRRVGGSLYLTGAVDEVAVFNIALEEADIQTIVNKGLGKALGIAAVSPAAKLTTTWGDIKTISNFYKK